MNEEKAETLRNHIELMKKFYFMGFGDKLLEIYMGCYFYKTKTENHDQEKKEILDNLSLLEEHYKTITFEELRCGADFAPLYVIHKLLPSYHQLSEEFKEVGMKWIENISDFEKSLDEILSGITEYEWLEFVGLSKEAGAPPERIGVDYTPLFTMRNNLSEYKKRVQQFLKDPNEKLYKERDQICDSIDNISCEGLGQGLNAEVGRTIIAIDKWFVRMSKEPIKELYERLDRIKNVIANIPFGDLYKDVNELKRAIENVSFEGLEFDFAPLFVVSSSLPKLSQKVKQFLEESTDDLYKEIDGLRTTIGYVGEIYRTNFERRIAELRSISNHKNFEVTLVRYDGQKYGF